MKKLIILLSTLTSGISMIIATPNPINNYLFEQSNLSKLADSVVLDLNAPENWDNSTINISGTSSKQLLPASGTTMYKFTKLKNVFKQVPNMKLIYSKSPFTVLLNRCLGVSVYWTWMKNWWLN